MLQGIRHTQEALQAVGDILQARDEMCAIVLVGGSALNLLGVIDRATRDVDIIALGEPPDAPRPWLREPGEALPPSLARAVALVARELNLRPDWMNTGPALQWKQGLPPGMADRVEWSRYGGLAVGLVGRLDLIFLKLYAAADAMGPSSVHYQDLIALNPSVEELEAARDWVRGQDVSPEFHIVVDKVLRHVQNDT